MLCIGKLEAKNQHVYVLCMCCVWVLNSTLVFSRVESCTTHNSTQLFTCVWHVCCIWKPKYVMCEVVCELCTKKKNMCVKVVYFQKNIVKNDLLLQKVLCYPHILCLFSYFLPRMIATSTSKFRVLCMVAQNCQRTWLL